MKPHNKLVEPVVGQKFEDWTVLEIGEWSSDSETTVFYRSEHTCGNSRKFTSSQLWSKKFKPCKKCEARVVYRKNHKEIILNNMYRQYKWSAKQRGYSFGISKDEFNKIVFMKCHYCGTEPNQKRSITEKLRSVYHGGEYILINGIDRINNSIGYEIENCAPCCFICNKAKSTMSVKEWNNMVLKWNEMVKING